MITAMATDPGHDDDKELPECSDCKGLGGYDASKDCEEYDDWQECPNCEGTGRAPEGDLFVPKRDAWGPND